MAAATIPQATAAPPLPSKPAQALNRRGLGAPSLLAAVCFSTGILLAQVQWVQPGQLFFALLALLALTALAATNASRMSLGLCGLVFLLTGLFCAEVQPRTPGATPLTRIADATPTPTPALHRQGIRTSHEIQGTVVRSGPLRLIDSFAPYSNKLRRERSRQADVRVSAVDGVLLPAPEGLRVTLYAPAEAPFPDLTCGSALRGAVEIHTQERFLDPGVWDARAWLRQQGISVLGSAHAENITVTGSNRHPSLACWLHNVQQRASERLIAFVSRPVPRGLPSVLRLAPDDAAMLTAMLTGDRTRLGHRLRIGFERTGSFHLLVVSGLHLAIFSGLIFWIARRLRLPRLAASCATMALSLAYALFTGFGQPVQRAFWMITLYLIGRLLWRERHPLNAIGFAALVMLVVHPSALLDAGLQMTLLSVFAVAGVAAPLAEKSFGPLLHGTRDLWLIGIDPSLPPSVAQFRVSLRMIAESLRPLIGSFPARRLFPLGVRRALLALELLLTSLAIEWLMALPMALYFHRVTTAALPVNVLLVPLLALLLPLALSLLFYVLLLPKVAIVPAAAVALLLHAVTALVRLFGGLRLGDLRIPAPPAIAIVAILALTAAALMLVRLRRFGSLAAAAALAAAAVLIVLPRPLAHRPGTLEISALDVGQGDSLLVITPHGRTLLIDAGGLVGAAGPNSSSPEAQSSNFDIGEDVVSPILWSRGIRRLDAVAITHAHADHIGGMPAVLANFRPRELWIGINPYAPLYDAVLAEARATRTRLVRHAAGDAFTLDDVRIRVLAPQPDYQPAPAPGNNDSLVLQMRYGQTTALLAGDAEAPSEERMLGEGCLHSDFLKIGHHGSRTSTTPAFLAAVAPSYAAVSVGKRNFYGHPRPEVLAELQQARVRTFRTDSLGLSTFCLDGSRVTAAAWSEH